MNDDLPVYLDLSWHRANRIALAMLCTLAAAWLSLAGLRPRAWASAELPEQPDRVAAVREWINPNTASTASLQRLPGIGPVKAQAILEYRQAGHLYHSVADLEQVSGIGPVTTRDIAPFLSLPKER